ncbi:hypothetical protein HZS_954 [Henneguya salminicola]|nr:hypothetical protein HZS_954 [Henneguya salminicola]
MGIHSKTQFNNLLNWKKKSPNNNLNYSLKITGLEKEIEPPLSPSGENISPNQERDKSLKILTNSESTHEQIGTEKTEPRRDSQVDPEVISQIQESPSSSPSCNQIVLIFLAVKISFHLEELIEKIPVEIQKIEEIPKNIVNSIVGVLNNYNESKKKINSDAQNRVNIKKASRIGGILLKLQQNYIESQVKFKQTVEPLKIGKKGIPLDMWLEGNDQKIDKEKPNN